MNLSHNYYNVFIHTRINNQTGFCRTGVVCSLIFTIVNALVPSIVIICYYSGWVDDSEHEVVYTVSRRLQAITGLSINNAELYQVRDLPFFSPLYDCKHSENLFSTYPLKLEHPYLKLGTCRFIYTWGVVSSCSKESASTVIDCER